MARNTNGLKRGGPGRPKGVPNRTTVAMREIALELTFHNPTYMQKLKWRLESGKIHPTVETFVLGHAVGKPPDKLELTGAEGGPIATVDATKLSTATIRQILSETNADAVPS